MGVVRRLVFTLRQMADHCSPGTVRTVGFEFLPNVEGNLQLQQPGHSFSAARANFVLYALYVSKAPGGAYARSRQGMGM